jgi:tetratricopeptide (TPR) repeat protein
LEVSYILRGTVTQINDQLRITVELINVVSNRVDWSESYDETFDENPLKLQQEVSQKIVAQLKIELNQNDLKALDNLLTKNQEASIYFNEGVRIADNRTSKNMDSILSVSANLFQKAIDLDPNYADAYAELAFISRLMNENNEIFNNNDRFKTIDSLSKIALTINPNTSRAYTALGAIAMYSNEDYTKAKTYLDKALSIKPNDATSI